MSAALEMVKIALQAYGGGDCAITMQLSDPLVRWDERASRPDGELVWGQDEVLNAMHRYLDSWEEYSFQVEKIAEISPGKIVGLCREHGKDESGTPVDRRYGGLWVVEDGKIVSWATYLTPKEAVKAAKELEVERFTPEGQPEPPSGEARPRPRRAPAAKPTEAPRDAAEPASFSEEQRKAAKRRAALARAAREGGRRARTG